MNFGKRLLICFNSSFLLERSRDFIAFPKGEYANLACSIICFRSGGNIYSHTYQFF